MALPHAGAFLERPRLVDAVELEAPAQPDRAAALRVRRALAVLVLPEPSFQVSRAPDVEGPVRALQDVHPGQPSSMAGHSPISVWMWRSVGAVDGTAAFATAPSGPPHPAVRPRPVLNQRIACRGPTPSGTPGRASLGQRVVRRTGLPRWSRRAFYLVTETEGSLDWKRGVLLGVRAGVRPRRRVHDAGGAGRSRGERRDGRSALARECHDDGVAVAVFPELCLSGYSIEDLLLQDTLLNAVQEAIATLVAASADLLPGDRRRARRCSTAPGC